MKLVLIVSIFIFVLREIVCIYEFRRYLKICSIRGKFSESERRILIYELKNFLKIINYNYRGLSKYLEEELEKISNSIDKLNLGMNLNYEELEYTKKMWVKYNLGFPLLTRIEFRIFEKMRCFYERNI